MQVATSEFLSQEIQKTLMVATFVVIPIMSVMMAMTAMTDLPHKQLGNH